MAMAAAVASSDGITVVGGGESVEGVAHAARIGEMRFGAAQCIERTRRGIRLCLNQLREVDHRGLLAIFSQNEALKQDLIDGNEQWGGGLHYLFRPTIPPKPPARRR